jgi:hypothetical protein
MSVPPAGAGQLPRGISVPQSNTQKPGDGSQLAKWQPSDNSTAAGTRTTDSPNGKPNDDKTHRNFELATSAGDLPKPQHDGVARASYDEPIREEPIRIVEPAAQRESAADEQSGKTAGRSAAGAAVRSATRFRKAPELTDFPPADSGTQRTKPQ